MQRTFASGSRQAPDPYDQYLEQEGFYRKHTARDSSSLFRTISEQMYDTQTHHLSVRETCVNYMRTHKYVFQKSIEKDIDEYLDELSKSKTCGTLIELHALAYLYRRNVLLFEPFNTGTWFIEEPEFKEIFRIFYSRGNHFDSVFTNDFVEAAAFCQAVTYEILYKNVFKLPDITYAVEKMLHANSFDYVGIKTDYDGPFMKQITLDDGRKFKLDRPENTNCILDNHLLCHFHNINFTTFSEHLHQDLYSQMKNSAQYDSSYRATKNSLLHDKYVSCVRQLLSEGITPFPYKVAKSLDPDIYRNIEFDSWSELKKDRNYTKWYPGANMFQAGVKCLVKLKNSQTDLFTCYIQNISPDKGPCLVFIEELGEKHVVPYEFLQPLPSNEIKPWSVPYRLHKYLCDNKSQNKINGLKSQYDWSQHYDYIDQCKKQIFINHDDAFPKNDYKLKRLTSIDNFRPTQFDFTTMPLTVEHTTDNNGNNKNSESVKNSNQNNDNSKDSPISDNSKQEMKNDEDNNELIPVSGVTTSGENYPYGNYSEQYFSSYPYDNSIIHIGAPTSMMPSNSAPPSYYCMYNSPYSNPGGVYMQTSPLHCVQQTPTANFYPGHFYPISPSGASNTNVINANATTTPLYHRNSYSSTLSTGQLGRINFAVGKSVLHSGSDLPTDIPTLQYFFNLGIDYYKQLQTNLNTDTTNVENKEINKLAMDFQTNLKVEENSSNNQKKPDSNNNNLSSNVTNNFPSQNSRRFNSRCFNNKKDYYKFQRNNNQRFAPPDATKNSGNKIASNTKVSSTNTMNTTSDRAIQITPVPPSTSDSEYTQNSVQHNPTHYRQQTVPQYPHTPATYSADGDQQLSNGTNVFVPPPLFSAYGNGPYGMFAPPPPVPTGQPSTTAPQHNGGMHHQAYMGPQLPPPPPPTQPLSVPPPGAYPSYPSNSFYSQNVDAHDTPVTGIETNGGNHYTYMNPYPPVFYSSTGNGNVASTAPPPSSGYWYLPPQSAMNLPVTNQGNSNQGKSSAQ